MFLCEVTFLGKLCKENQAFMITALVVFILGSCTGYLSHSQVKSDRFLNQDMHLKSSQKPSTIDFMFHNIEMAFILMIGGLLTLGFASIAMLFINGIVVGESIAVAQQTMSAYEIILKILPHGIFEIPAILLAGTGGFLSLKIFLRLLREQPVNYKGELSSSLYIACGIVLLLTIAAVVEAYITPS